MVMSFSFVACGNKDKGGTPPVTPQPDPIVVTINDAVGTIATGETIALTATVTGTDNKAVTWSVSDPATLAVTEDGVVSVFAAPQEHDKNVIVTATSKADPKASASKSIRVKAIATPGKVGDLTSEMITAIGNDSITVAGTVTDKYIDNHDTSNNRTNVYESKVTMEKDKWSGSWRTKGSDEPYITNVYKRGPQSIKYAQYNYNEQIVGYTTGSEMIEEYINKDNEVASKRVTDAMSVPSAWETQHLWNHLGNLNVNKFTYEVDNLTEYTFELGDSSTVEENYLMAYLVVSLTPMLSGTDSFRSITLTIADGKIASLKGQSNVNYIGATYNESGTLEDWDAMSYTVVDLAFSDVGSTTVVGVTPYTAPENADKLTAALSKLHNATSYAYEIKDVTTSAPELDDGDYSVESVSTSAFEMGSRNAAVNCGITPKNRTSATGTVGTRGWVTPNAILIEKTSKYSYTMDDKPYKLEYTGYKQFDGYYDEFEYDGTIKNEQQEVVGGLRGAKRVEGNISSILPKFEFSANLFSCTEGIQGGKQIYIYTLKATSVTREIARQITMHNADSAEAISGSSFTLTVDENNNLISARIPYSITQGTYIGYYTIKFLGVGETTIDMSKIDTNYVERGIRNNWSEYTTKYYDAISYDKDGKIVRERINDMNAQAAIDDIYGANKADLPQAEKILEIFGDNFSGPFYDDREMTNADGTTYLRRNISLTIRSTVLDDNGQVANFDELVKKCDDVFGALGFTKDLAQTDVSGGESGRSTRYVVYTTDKITIVLENNFSKNFWMYFYNAGEYNRAPQEEA